MLQTIENRVRLSEPVLGVLGSRRAAGSRKALERNAPNLLADYLYLWETTAVRQAIETARTSVSSGGHSSSYWCQQRQLALRLGEGWSLAAVKDASPAAVACGFTASPTVSAT